MDKSHSRYPYTYAADYIRLATVDPFDPYAGCALSRGAASKIRKKVAEALGIDDDTAARMLADAYLSGEKACRGSAKAKGQAMTTDEMIEVMAREIVAAQGMGPDERDSISWLPIWQMLGTGPARAALAAILPDLVDDVKHEILRAYVAGATAVHEHWQIDVEPDFQEAAHDYAASRTRFDQIAKEIEG